MRPLQRGDQAVRYPVLPAPVMPEQGAIARRKKVPEMKYPEELLTEKVRELEAENARLRREVQELIDELAYHGVYPK